MKTIEFHQKSSDPSILFFYCACFLISVAFRFFCFHTVTSSSIFLNYTPYFLCHIWIVLKITNSLMYHSMTLAFILLEIIEFEVQTKTQEKRIIHEILIHLIIHFNFFLSFHVFSDSIISRSMNARIILWYINEFVILSTIQISHKK